MFTVVIGLQLSNQWTYFNVPSWYFKKKNTPPPPKEKPSIFVLQKHMHTV